MAWLRVALLWKLYVQSVLVLACFIPFILQLLIISYTTQFFSLLFTSFSSFLWRFSDESPNLLAAPVDRRNHILSFFVILFIPFNAQRTAAWVETMVNINNI